LGLSACLTLALSSVARPRSPFSYLPVADLILTAKIRREFDSGSVPNPLVLTFYFKVREWHDLSAHHFAEQITAFGAIRLQQ
jgi:hypothetical protein